MKLLFTSPTTKYTFCKFFIAFLLILSRGAVAQTWTQKADFINGGSLNAYAFSINDSIYVGNTGATGFYKFDYTTNTWSQKANVPAVLFNRTGAAGFAINGKGYVVGGINASGVCTNDVWEYSPASDSWLQKADFPGGKRTSTGFFVVGNKAYLGGGNDTIDLSGFSLGAPKNDFWQYDPSADAWTAEANIPYDSSYLLAPFAFSVNGKGYFSCGYRCRLAFGAYHDTDVNTTFEYDPASNTWTPRAGYPGMVRSGGVSFVLGNTAYCGTGINDTTTSSSGSCYHDFYAYDAVINSWSVVPAPPFAARTYSVASTVSTGKAYLGTGWGAPSTTMFYDDWWEFKPAAEGILAEHDAEVRIQCYPNPCITEFAIRIPEHDIEGYAYAVYSLTGQKVMEGLLPAPAKINITPLANDNFILAVRGDNKEYRCIFSVIK